MPVKITKIHKILLSFGGSLVFGNPGTGVGVDVTLGLGVIEGVGFDVEVGVNVAEGASVNVDVGIVVNVGEGGSVNVGIGVDVNVGVGVGVDVGGTAQIALETIFVSNVTAAFRASTLPFMFAPVVSVIDVNARIFPCNVEFVPKVAELPTCQETLHACASLIRDTTLALAVVSVEPILKINTELRSFWPSSVNVPVN